MRKIKFRIWCNETYHKEQYNILFSDGSWKISDWENGKTLYSDALGDEAIIEQYTGLKDKNGVEIYEGDRLKVTHTNWWQEHKIEKVWSEDAVVSFNDYDNSIQLKGKGKKWNVRLRELTKNTEEKYLFEVIGNIHEEEKE